MTTHHRHVRRGVWALLLLLVAVPVGGDESAGDDGSATDALPRLDAEAPRPAPITPPSTEEIDAAVRRGVDFLVRRQNPNGSWGSARNTKDLNVYAPTPGAHHAFRAGVTSLCLSALIESGDRRDEVAAAIDRGEAWMLEHLPSLRRATPDAIYNTWGHAYGIQGLASMYRRHDGDPATRDKIKREVEHQIELLGRYECVDGGWCYYDMNYETQKPSGPTMSFVTATVLVALADAKAMGVEAPKRLVDRAMESIRRQRKPDFTYCYGEYLKYRPMHEINRPGGSVGRSQACNLAMHLWDDEKTTPAVMRTWLDRLFARNLWLDIGRKRPIPHESWFKVAGYFYYYGHYYAAATIEHLEPAERPHFQNHLAHILLGLQEKDGSWWDYPLYDYHQQYGTAFAVMSLLRCKPDGKAVDGKR
ncbi:MAG: terpene cyclase/mutase family protein [Planctomycetia bacterium]|nr:terpene cyclase/mutase family protein [Planctomycetia bacterium]